ENVDLAELRKLAWSGVPDELRPMVWQLLLGYLPAPTARRAATLARKRSEYASLVKQAFSRGVKGLDGPLWHQISIDVPRTRPGVPLWQAEATQRSLERVLYVWAIRHPASGYVQGINDLVTPFFQVFLASYIDADPETFDVSVLAPEVLEALEADSFWCLSKLLDGIQDNYIFAQPGIQRLVKKMETLCGRVDAPLAAHLKEQGVEFIQFAFRWMNCLLMRELSVKNIVRMWDTYLVRGDAFSEFHLYVCLAFLVRWSDQLREMDFQSIIMFLQSLPTQNWSDKDTELLLSEAFMWSRTFVAR
ncbi:RabGAP/TBC, partial [Rhodotorula sp. JG-1b]